MTVGTPLEATEDTNLVVHESKKLMIMAHNIPVDPTDADGGPTVDKPEPSWARKLLIKVKKTFCLQLSVQERLYEAHVKEKMHARGRSCS
jgi:hypothetical protein